MIMGAVCGRQADLSSLLAPSTIYQMEVSFKQEFHTLLTMWLLSAAASAPIPKCSSFLPFLGPLSVSFSLPYFNPSRGFCPVGCQKKRQGPDIKIKGRWLVREVWLRCGFVFKVLCWFSWRRKECHGVENRPNNKLCDLMEWK